MQSIYELLGGRYHQKLRAYAYMPAEGTWENPEKAGEVAAKLVEEGNTACKLDPFMPLYPLPRDFTLSTINHAAHTSIPIASGERLSTKYEFAELIEKQAAQIIQLDLAQCGGIL